MSPKRLALHGTTRYTFVTFSDSVNELAAREVRQPSV